MDVLRKFWCCTHGPAVMSFVSTQSEIRLCHAQRNFSQPKEKYKPCIKSRKTTVGVPFKESVETTYKKPARASSCKPVPQKGDTSDGLDDSSFIGRLLKGPSPTKPTCSEFRLTNCNPFANAKAEPEAEVFKKSNIPYPKAICAAVPERLDKYSLASSRGRSVARYKPEYTEKKPTKAESAKNSIAKSRKSVISEGTPAKMRKTPKKNSSCVAPSQNSTFRYVPHYFKPEILKKFKFDADLVTALAKAAECRQRGNNTGKSRLSGSEVTETVTTVSTAAVTSRTSTAKADAGNVGQINV